MHANLCQLMNQVFTQPHHHRRIHSLNESRKSESCNFIHISGLKGNARDADQMKTEHSLSEEDVLKPGIAYPDGLEIETCLLEKKASTRPCKADLAEQ